MGGSGGGSSGGGGTTTTTTKNETLPWASYVPPETYGAYKELMPKLGQKYDVGLSPEERTFYTGRAMTDIGKQYGSASKGLTESLARSGVGPTSGAAVESLSDLARNRAASGAEALGNISGMDLQKKSENLANIMKAISIPGSPIQIGSTSNTQYSPANTGGS